ncbi:MAG TPA: molecular chaperone HtpG [Planctomycetaceae bacterium]|nr:molecular chaperone HtpG [Planctomycetaceae bacterium]
MTTTQNSEQFTFQAEIKQLLHLLSHSLYQNREIAIRELVSNASDALDKMRFRTLTEGGSGDGMELEISIDPDTEAKVLTIADNGIGMTKNELIENLGTIAHSGSKAFLSQLGQEEKNNVSLIGQFGVGFYSAFMLADRVEVLTRSSQEETGWRWESEGTGQFTIEAAEDLPRGTQIRLHLKSDLVDEFTRVERLKHILRTYSTFVAHPLKLAGEHLNTQPPIWVEPKAQLKDEQYNQFYQFLTHRVGETPRWHLHLASETPFEFKSILFCPESNFEKLGFGKTDHGLHLCAKRILVQNDCDKLLPEWLRFLHGLVDSADLPLNVSREALQDNTVFRKIRKVLIKKVLDELAEMQTEKRDAYLDFYREFGAILREGIATEFDQRDRLSKLVMFHSPKIEGLTSLDEYVSRMPEGQEQIYYICGQNLATIARNPNLEIFRKRETEVLYLTDPVDEIVLSNLGKFAEKQIVSIDSADAKLPARSDSSETQPEEEVSKNVEGFEKVLELFRESIGDKIAEVRKSDRLTDSPCCLVNKDGRMSTQLQKVLSLQHEDFQMSERIFEVNPDAALIKRLSEISGNPENHEFIRNSGQLLLDQALLQEGIAPDGSEMAMRIMNFMQELAEAKSSIIT